MYQPKQFEENRPEVLRAVVQQHPLALLITLSDDGLQADPIPLLWRENAVGQVVLAGHVARANPLWQRTRFDTEVLAVFQGPQHYISPGWYATKAEHGRAVPTWNYVTVQARGPLRVVQDPAWLRQLVDDLTNQQEAPMPQPWQVGDAPADYISKMLAAIIGIEIPVTQWVGKWKTSQNQPSENQASLVQALNAMGETSNAARDMAALVRAGAAG
ncbi:MAG: FMN-binding negative transcriptional regulator [Rhodoferax sp.]|nr:MAG: FMN-binding negative transcriptional regulator [Rhodoferax sp.]